MCDFSNTLTHFQIKQMNHLSIMFVFTAVRNTKTWTHSLQL